MSQNMQKTLSEWKERGYEVKSASVRFIVAWKPKDAPKDEPETAVLLPDLFVIVKTCSDSLFSIGQKISQLFVAKLRNFLDSHNRMVLY